MAIESDKALLCKRKLRRALSFFETPGEIALIQKLQNDFMAKSKKNSE